jgi:hypothetical protein
MNLIQKGERTSAGQRIYYLSGQDLPEAFNTAQYDEIAEGILATLKVDLNEDTDRYCVVFVINLGSICCRNEVQSFLDVVNFQILFAR